MICKPVQILLCLEDAEGKLLSNAQEILVNLVTEDNEHRFPDKEAFDFELLKKVLNRVEKEGQEFNDRLLTLFSDLVSKPMISGEAQNSCTIVDV